MDQTVVFEAAEGFSVPNEIVDRYLNAPEEALRLILFLLRNKNHSFLTSELCEKLGIGENELNSAFAYWEKNGILCSYGGRYRLERPRVQASDILRYSPETIAERMEDPSVCFLYKQAEQMMGRPLTADDAATVLSMTDWVGLPAEVAALLMNYMASIGTKSIRKVLSAAVKWEEDGITSYEAAENRINELTKHSETEKKIAMIIGISGRALTKDESEAFCRWGEDYGFSEDMIREAFNRTVHGTGNYKLAYMNKILTAWFEEGIKEPKNIKDVSKTSKKHTVTTNSKHTLDTEAAEASSWDIIDRTLEGDKQDE